MTSSTGASRGQKGITGNTSSTFDRRAWGENRLSDLKKTIWKDSMAQSWVQVLEALKEKVEEIESAGSKVRSSTRHPLLSFQR